MPSTAQHSSGSLSIINCARFVNDCVKIPNNIVFCILMLRTYNGSPSYPSGGASGVDDRYDQMLNQISHNIETLGTSIDMGTNMDDDLPKTT